jgi:hypothetical protein
MAKLRVRVLNLKSLEKSLPQLQRSLSVQKKVQLVEESHGVFLLEFLSDVDMKDLKHIRRLLDKHGFEFYYPTLDHSEMMYVPQQNWMPGCNCSACKALRDQYNAYYGTDH